MDIKTFSAHIAEEFPDVAPETLTPDSYYKDVIGLTSINALILIALVDAAYDVLLSADDIKSTKTLVELFEVVKNYKTK